MAKVTGPLMSMDARGAFGKAMVFMGWKGLKTARMWLKPANPQSAGQGNIRTIIGAVGRAVGKVIAEAAYAVKLVNLGVVPDQQSKQSYLVQYIKDVYMTGSGATLKSNYATILKEFTAHTGEDAFNTAAAGIGLSDFGMVYDDIAVFPKGLGLYLLAKAAIALSFTGVPYSATLSAWTAADIAQLVNHLS
jgi:hypothetical protein